MTRENSPVLCVTSTQREASAVPAINVSIGPIGFPSVSRNIGGQNTVLLRSRRFIQTSHPFEAHYACAAGPMRRVSRVAPAHQSPRSEIAHCPMRNCRLWRGECQPRSRAQAPRERAPCRLTVSPPPVSPALFRADEPRSDLPPLPGHWPGSSTSDIPMAPPPCQRVPGSTRYNANNPANRPRPEQCTT